MRLVEAVVNHEMHPTLLVSYLCCGFTFYSCSIQSYHMSFCFDHEDRSPNLIVISEKTRLYYLVFRCLQNCDTTIVTRMNLTSRKSQKKLKSYWAHNTILLFIIDSQMSLLTPRNCGHDGNGSRNYGHQNSFLSSCRVQGKQHSYCKSSHTI